MDLTPRERQAYDLRRSTDPPLVWREVGRLMNVSMATARLTGARAAEKLTSPNVPHGSTDRDGSRLEYRDPEKAAEAIDALTNPLAPTFAAAARETGLPKSTARDLRDRLARDYQPVYENVTNLKSSVFIKALERNAIAALEAITPEKYEKMNGYQLTLMAAISLDKKLLLEGKPTQNISLTVEDRRSVAELIAEIHCIAEQRGYMKEVNPETNQVRLADREDAPIETLLHRTSKQLMPRIDPEDA